MQLARRYQQIEQALKEANRSKLVQDRIAKQSANQRNNGSNRQPIVNSPAISAASPANLNATTSRMARISQPQAQLAAPSLVRTTSTTTMTTNSATSRLTTKEIDRLMKFGKCFNCKEERHTSRNCTRPSKLYLSVSAALQEVTLVEDASDLGKE